MENGKNIKNDYGIFIIVYFGADYWGDIGSSYYLSQGQEVWMG